MCALRWFLGALGSVGAVAFRLDLLLAHILGNLLLFGDGVLRQTDTLLGDDPLLRYDLLLRERDLVLIFGDLVP